MMSIYTRKLSKLVVALVFIMPVTVSAEEPVIQTEGTVIYLADNLQEEAKLGWCLDTRGRGFGEQLHAHSCKPQGGDVQFSFDEESGKIQSVAFEGKCMTLSDPENTEIPFGLFDCVEGDVNQQFSYDIGSMEFRLASDESKCVAVADSISQAGPFQSRQLIFAPCAELASKFKQWVIRK